MISNPDGAVFVSLSRKNYFRLP